jgi:ABC-type branched-subunit amino acid transport system substrate-binding protein
VAPFEGRYRYVGYDVFYAVRLALYEANDSDGLSGYGVELVAYDDGGDPAMAEKQARKLAVDLQVMGTLGHFRSPTTAAALSAYAESRLPLVVPTGLPSEVEEWEDAWAMGPPAEGIAGALLDRAAAAPGDGGIVLVGEDAPVSRAVREMARRRGLGLTMVDVEVEGWRREVAAQDPAVLLCELEPVKAGEVVLALREDGWAGSVIGGPSLAMTDFVAVAGASAAGAVFVTPWPFPGDVPDGAAFAAAYGEVSGGLPPGPFALPAYEATWALLEALEEAAGEGVPTRKAVLAALAGSRGQRASVIPAVEIGETLYWYRIGPDGAPVLLRQARAWEGSEASVGTGSG